MSVKKRNYALRKQLIFSTTTNHTTTTTIMDETLAKNVLCAYREATRHVVLDLRRTVDYVSERVAWRVQQEMLFMQMAFKLKQKTLHLGTQLFFRVCAIRTLRDTLATLHKNPAEATAQTCLEMYTVACMWIAIKLFEYETPDAKFLMRFYNKIFRIEDIVACEKRILQHLNGDLWYPTLPVYLSALALKWNHTNTLINTTAHCLSDLCLTHPQQLVAQPTLACAVACLLCAKYIITFAAAKSATPTPPSLWFKKRKGVVKQLLEATTPPLNYTDDVLPLIQVLLKHICHSKLASSTCMTLLLKDYGDGDDIDMSYDFLLRYGETASHTVLRYLIQKNLRKHIHKNILKLVYHYGVAERSRVKK